MGDTNNEGSHVNPDLDSTSTLTNGNGKVSRFKSAMRKLIYMSNGEFSITRIMMVVSFFISIALAVTGVVIYLGWDKTLPNNVYDYVFKLTGGGIIQYGLTKIVGEFGNSSKNGDSTSTTPSNSSTGGGA